MIKTMKPLKISIMHDWQTDLHSKLTYWTGCFTGKIILKIINQSYIGVHKI